VVKEAWKFLQWQLGWLHFSNFNEVSFHAVSDSLWEILVCGMEFTRRRRGSGVLESSGVWSVMDSTMSNAAQLHIDLHGDCRAVIIAFSVTTPSSSTRDDERH
jgi:hypothetical protein